MKLSITKKLVAAFVGLTFVVLAATLLLARWSFQQGFLDYINALELTRLERLQSSIAQEYLAAEQTWSAVDARRFGNLLRDTNLGGNALAPNRVRNGRPPRLGPPRSGAGPNSASRGMPPTALYDANGKHIAGPQVSAATPGVIRVDVVLNGMAIGELRSEPRRQLTTPLATAFSQQQLKTSWTIGACCLLLALGLSIWLARGLLGPVQRMITAVSSLSRGDYSQQLLEENRGDELGALTRDLDRLAATLASNRSSRQRLLADISHELRTPLTVLTGEIEALKDGVRPFDAEQLTSLDQEVSRLRLLIDDLYEFALSDVGGLRYELQAIDLSACVSTAVSAVLPRAEQQGISLKLAGQNPALLMGDRKRLDQLLRNLLENSLAYTDTPGEIHVAVATQADEVIVTIEDTAPGASVEECDALFDPLYRLDRSRSRHSGGAGLGLAICQNIVTAHDGKLQASPSPFGGIQIVATFPGHITHSKEESP